MRATQRHTEPLGDTLVRFGWRFVVGGTLLLFILGMVVGNEVLGDNVDDPDLRNRQVMGDVEKHP